MKKIYSNVIPLSHGILAPEEFSMAVTLLSTFLRVTF